MGFRPVSGKCIGAWCFAAVVPGAIQLCGMSWATVGVICILCFVAVIGVARWGRYENKLFGVLRLGALPIILGQLLRAASECWPGDDQFVIPLSLLAVAVWSAHKGSGAAARVGVVLFWAVLGLYLAVLASGAGQVRLEWLRPRWSAVDWSVVVVLLIPLVALPLVKPGEMAYGKWLTAIIYIVGAAAVTAGVLSPKVAQQLPGAFYELSRSLQLLGVTQRFEAVVSAAMTVGWFALTSLLLCGVGNQAEKIKNEWGSKGVFTGGLAAAVWMLLGVTLEEWGVAICLLVLWGIIPVVEYAISTKND